MLGLILSVVYLFLGFFIGVFVYSNMVLPLLWLPYVMQLSETFKLFINYDQNRQNYNAA